MIDGNILFKEWLPDLPDLNNPGSVEALNVVPHNTVYKSYNPLAASGSTLGSAFTPVAGYLAQDGRFYAYAYNTAGSFILREDIGWTAVSSVGNFNTDGADFVEFDQLLIVAAGADPMLAFNTQTSGSFSALATSGSNPSARHVGVIGRIVVAGGFPNGASGTTTSYVRWASIDSPRDWPLPGSDTAIARQSGEQWMDRHYGEVTSIVSGDQYGLIFQRHGINRVTYIGGSVVFQFDNYEAERGAYFWNATISISGATYFISDKGFFVTDGSSVTDIGTNKVTRFFLGDVDFTYFYRVRACADMERNLIYWCYPSTTATGGRPNRILIYNYAENRWAHANQECWALFNGGDAFGFYTNKTYPMGFSQGLALSRFNGTPGSAVLTTGEAELNPGGYAHVSGVKPLVDATAMTVALGTRGDLAAAASFTSEVTASARSGFSDFRSASRYQRARVTIAGTFNAAQGVEFLAKEDGQF